MQDTTLVYSGGSGGFLMLHLMMLSGWNARFFKDFTMDELLQQQWNIKEIHAWKKSEIWPVNDKTIQAPNPRLFFMCEPVYYDIKKYTNNYVVIYTDIQSQLALCRAKKALWFVNPKDNIEEIEYQRLKQSHYESVRDPSWPVSVDDASAVHLAEMHQDEYWQKLESAGSWDGFLVTQSPWYQGRQVLNDIVPWLENAQHSILLQDLVNNPREQFAKLGAVYTDRHQQLIDHWRSLHPPELLQRIGISTH